MSTNPTKVVWRRIFAFIVDSLFIEVAAAVVLVVMHGVRERTSLPSCEYASTRELCWTATVNGSSRVYTVGGNAAWIALAVLLGMGFLIRVLMQGLSGTTPGMSIFGIRCAKKNGGVCGVGRAFVRWIFLPIDFISLFIPLGLWVIIFTKNNRRIGDLVAGTYVVRKAAMGSPLELAGSEPEHPPAPFFPGPAEEPTGFIAPAPAPTPPPAPAPTPPPA
ncbi:MAG: RDD family protein, partial [Acidimicrobiia bacterium]